MTAPGPLVAVRAGKVEQVLGFEGETGERAAILPFNAKSGTGHERGHQLSYLYPEKSALHRRKRLSGQFDRALALPLEIDADGVKEESRDGILALYLPRAERDKPKSIQVT